MKKVCLIVALSALGFSLNAQSINVQSAIQDLKKNYLNKAKMEIDLACEHESTKDDAKTWCYKGLIYARIGGDAQSKKPKFKNLAPDWAEQAYAAAIECKRLDTKNEWASENNSVFRFVGNEYYTRAADAFNNQNYADAMNFSDRAVEMFQNSGDRQFANESLYIAGMSARAQKDNDNMVKYFNKLITAKTDKDIVYRYMFTYYKDNGEKDKAMNVATRYLRNHKDNYRANLMMAEGYLLNDNLEKGRDMINQALEKTKDSVALYSQLLSASAAILEGIKDYEGAEAKYNESLTLTPSQFEANFGMGKMIYNRAVDKIEAANAVPPTDETGLYEKLMAESIEFFDKSINYFRTAVDFVDNMPSEEAKAQKRQDLYSCLVALKTCYTRLEKYDELKGINARIEQMQQSQKIQ